LIASDRRKRKSSAACVRDVTEQQVKGREMKMGEDKFLARLQELSANIAEVINKVETGEMSLKEAEERTKANKAAFKRLRLELRARRACARK
jgi:hypothetical protein